MEGVGSRLGRASSRYGTATAVFTGPVRKWKKKWVHVSQSTLTYQNNSNSHSYSQSQSTTTTINNNNNGGSRLILCRWTPLSPTPAAAAAAATADSGSGSADEPPRRKFRYTPIAVLEEQKRAVVKKAEDEAITSETNQSMRPNSDEVLKEETQDSHISHLDLGLCLTGPNSNVDSVGQNRESQMESASSSGFGQHIEVQNFLKTN
ncbi:uncharacterized protein LOC115954855 [Quercus lobata]|uniref:Uncharacterized protein n=1 Tax=Quercus lobata TaxID=97700 RepID=A0A7N2M793_QUELO|nr:uncharacterized protein LOC115954855 [Quercus lobata]